MLDQRITIRLPRALQTEPQPALFRFWGEMIPYPLSYSLALRTGYEGQRYALPCTIGLILAYLDLAVHVILWLIAVACDLSLYNTAVDTAAAASTVTATIDATMTIDGSISLMALVLTLLALFTFVLGLLKYMAGPPHLQSQKGYVSIRAASDVPGFGVAFLLGGLRVSSLASQGLMVIIFINPTLYPLFHTNATFLDGSLYQILFAIAAKEFLVFLLAANASQARWQALLPDRSVGFYSLPPEIALDSCKQTTYEVEPCTKTHARQAVNYF